MLRAFRYTQNKPKAQTAGPAIQINGKHMKEYKAIPFAPDVKADLTTYVVEKGIDGIFHYIAIEEAAIRQNPVKRTTELLQKVFGAK